MKTLGNLLAGLALMAAGSFAIAETPKILEDREFYTKGPFIAYAAPWSTYEGVGEALKPGVDFVDEITVQPDSFPANVEFSWHWPLTPPKSAGVYGYNAVSFGSYDGGIPQSPIESRQVKNLRTLVETFDFEMAHPIGDFNVLTELFVTDKALGTKIAEVGFFLRASKSAAAFVEAGEQLGKFTDAFKREWKVAVQSAPAGPYYMFLPTSEVATGSVDFKAALDFLKAKGRLTGDEWFNGLAFGIEPVAGSGSLRLKTLSVDYQ